MFLSIKKKILVLTKNHIFAKKNHTIFKTHRELLFYGAAYKELGNHHSHSHKKNAEQNKNQKLFLDSS